MIGGAPGAENLGDTGGDYTAAAVDEDCLVAL